MRGEGCRWRQHGEAWRLLPRVAAWQGMMTGVGGSGGGGGSGDGSGDEGGELLLIHV